MPHSRPLPVADRLIAWSLSHPLSRVTQYLVAAAAIVAVGILRSMLVTTLVPWLLFIPIVLIVGLMLGRGPSVFATGLATVVAGITIGAPREPLWLTAQQWIASVLFLIVTSGIAVLAAELRASFVRTRRLIEERAAATGQLAEREAFLASVLASSTDCIKVLDLDGRITFMSEGGQTVMEVSDFNDIAGCPWPDFWTGSANAEAREAVAAAKAGRPSTFIGKAETLKGTPKWWNVAVSAIPGQDGRPARILSVSRDITASRQTEERSAQLARIVENSRDFIGVARLDGSVSFLNDAAHDLVGLRPEELASKTIVDFFPPEEAAIVAAEVLPAVDRTGSWTGERIFRHFGTGELIPVLYSVIPVFGHDGALNGYSTVTRDLRERKHAEEQQRLLNNELGHRLKNVLTVVQSVAAQTLRQAPDLQSASEALSARLVALGEAANVLTAGSWAAADLRTLVERALAPHGEIGVRFRLSGPDLVLQPQVGLAFALALHELATNAVKYGALSMPDGFVDVKWEISSGSNDAEPRFTFAWREAGGPPVRPPTRRGFGSTMIERSLRAYFRGQAAVTYAPNGVEFHLDGLLRDAAQPTE